ncbi:MAG: FecR domain-containing protein [Cyclobacteriaceae bacterium]
MSDWLNHDSFNFDTDSKNELEKITDYPNVTGRPEQSWNAIERRISAEKASFGYKAVLRIAAVISLLVVGTLFIIETQKPEVSQLSTLQNQQEYKLPDGSYLLLDRNTVVSYSTDFEENRILSLEKGKIFLDVKHTGGSFKVESKDFNVEVLGTSFSLDESDDLVYVFDGQVAVYNDQHKVKLQKGESLAIINSQFVLNQVSKNDIAWKTNDLDFENVAFSEVIDVLNKHYNTKIVYSKALANCRVSATFKQQNLNETVEVLSTILNAKAKINSKKITISGKSCQ